MTQDNVHPLKRRLAADEMNYKTRIMAEGVAVIMSLPHGQHIRMTPDQARQIGGRLFLMAAEASGEPAPAIIALEVQA